MGGMLFSSSCLPNGMDTQSGDGGVLSIVLTQPRQKVSDPRIKLLDLSSKEHDVIQKSMV
eukprot:6123828-Pleurochrysis_carterae.AAC.1